MNPIVDAFFDRDTCTVSYVASDPNTRVCAVVDPVLDFDPASGRTATTSADRIAAYVRDNELIVAWVLETHVHADHLTAAPYFQDLFDAKVAIGKEIRTVQEAFGRLFNVESDFPRDGSQFCHLFAEGERFAVGDMEVEVWHTPGHTPACVSYLIGDAAFVGDTLFMPDYGTARCDFPGGDARTLYRSIRRILSLPDETRIFTCHDYAPGGREFAWESTVADQRDSNIHVADGVSEDEFVEMRSTRDATLSMPRLILPSVQVNMRAGRMPPAEDNGLTYLKIPIDSL